MQGMLSVGQVAKRAGINVSAVHFYEQKGLLHAERNAGNQRRYDRSVLRRIAIIKTAQQLGVSLQEVADALAALPAHKAPDKADWQKLSQHWQDRLDQRIAQLTRLRDELDQCIGCGCLSLTYCPIRNRDDALAKQGNGAVCWLDER